MPPFISYRSSGEKSLKYQANSPCVIMSLILMTTLIYKELILQGEFRCWSLLGLNGLMPSKYHTTGPCSGAQCEHCFILQTSLLLFGHSKTRGKRSYEQTEQIPQWLPSLSVHWWKPLLLINGNRKLTCKHSVIFRLTSAFCLVFIMKVNYLRPSQKGPRLLRIQNVCFIPVKFPESPATVYGELKLKNLNGG